MSPLFVVDQTPSLWSREATTAHYRPLLEESTPRPVIVPLSKSFGHLDHIELGQYQQTMSQRDFNFFLAFAGGDTFGFTDSDLEVFYPPEE